MWVGAFSYILGESFKSFAALSNMLLFYGWVKHLSWTLIKGCSSHKFVFLMDSFSFPFILYVLYHIKSEKTGVFIPSTPSPNSPNPHP